MDAYIRSAGSAMTGSMIELLRARRSIRSYQDRPLEREKVAILTEAALRSPSSRNLDPWDFVFVEDRGLLKRLAKCKPHGAGFLANAALGIVVCGRPKESDTWIEDCSIAAILIQMTAQSLGLGSCWIQVRLREHDERSTAEEYVKQVLGIPKGFGVLCILAVGYPAEQRTPQDYDSLRHDRIHVNHYAIG